MDYYQIGAMKVFSELGQLIEDDGFFFKGIKDLRSDIMGKIGSYLLEDKNKTIHKIFKNRKDDDLQVLLISEVKDVTYISIYSSDNEIDYQMNDNFKKLCKFYIKSQRSRNYLPKNESKFLFKHIPRYKKYKSDNEKI